ncbi:hypothetical protein ACFXC8_43190 [Streptomyces sp. NPDC059441]|uniref:glycine-rich domain-containing protein n=1 Tax=Streptomyces sp. NPDC059441 TaxID=3346829 RepID=UPI0036CEFC6A
MSESIFRELFMKFIPSSRPRRAVLVSAMAAASLLSPGTASAASAAQVQTFASVGKHTFTVPQGVSHIRIVALGGGAGGGGGGGNNDGPLTGGGGGGGGSSAVVSCLIPVKSGSKIPLTVGSGGKGGKGGSDDNGHWGANGTNTTVGIGGILASAEHGWEAGGGNASNLIKSGDGGRAGGGGGAKASRCEGTDSTITPGNGGQGGHDGSRNDRGGGGDGGTPARWPDSCPTAGVGGGGGIGAGPAGASNPGHQVPSTPGYAGNDGCVVLTYTTDASSS